MGKKPHGAGKSSYDLVDVGLLFSEIGLREGHAFMDVACGRGAYSLTASGIVGRSGKVHAFDLWQEGIDALKHEALAGRISNIDARTADVARRIPLDDGVVDIALMAMVVHDLMRDGSEEAAVKEVRRVLKTAGALAVVEFKKKEGPPGPPIDIRLSPEALRGRLAPLGFKAFKSLDLGTHSYLTVFNLQ